MSADDLLRQVLAALEVNDDCTEATLRTIDGSCLHFCHRVGERWVRATPAQGAQTSQAQRLLESVARFRLNGKHLDVTFADGSRWEARFR